MRLEYFQMIDEVTAIDLAEGSIAVRSVTPAESPVFEGHFPGWPIMPGTLLIETMAQAAGFFVLARTEFAAMPFLMTVDSAKIRTFVEPSTELSVKAQMLHEGSGFTVAKAMITSAAKRICEAELKLRVMPAENAELAAMVRSKAEEIGLVRAICAYRAMLGSGAAH